MAWIIQGGQVLRDTALVRDDLCISDGIIAENAKRDARRFDASGLLVMPGRWIFMAMRMNGNSNHALALAFLPRLPCVIRRRK
jgi:formylmethanofuran dehydrogenase subunit A